MWVFAYGSLIWRPDIPVAETRVGQIRGWTRGFFQASPDHRGTPDAPGRVVTLVRDPLGAVGGLAYRVPDSEAEGVLRRLDHREKAGYEHVIVPVYALGRAAGSTTHADNSADNSNADNIVVASALVYVASPGNPNFIGPQPAEQIAQIAARRHGPSGPNHIYVTELDDALKRLEIVDEHIADVARHVRRILAGIADV